MRQEAEQNPNRKTPPAKAKIHSIYGPHLWPTRGRQRLGPPLLICTFPYFLVKKMRQDV